MSKTIMISDSTHAKIKASAERNFRSLTGELDYMLMRLDALEKSAVSSPSPSIETLTTTPVQEAIVDKMYDAGLRRKAIEDEIYSRPDIAQLKQEIDDVNAQLEDIEDSGEAKVLIERIRELEDKRDSLISEAKVEANI